MPKQPEETSTRCTCSSRLNRHRRDLFPRKVLFFLLAASASQCRPFILRPAALCGRQEKLISESRKIRRPETFVRRYAKPPSLVEESKEAVSAENFQNVSTDADQEMLQEHARNNDLDEEKEPAGTGLSRREWFQQCAVVVGGTAMVGTAFVANDIRAHEQQETLRKRRGFIRLEPYPTRRKPSSSENTKVVMNVNQNATSLSRNQTANVAARVNATTLATPSATPTAMSDSSNTSAAASNRSTLSTSDKIKATVKANNATTKELAPVNFTKVAAENSINITLKDCKGGCVRVDGTTLQKVKTPERDFPWFLPKFLKPAPKVIKDIPDSEIFLAATVAGSIIEMGRTLTLYPLSTIKTRIQTRQQEKQKSKGFPRMERFHSNSSLRLRLSQTNHTVPSTGNRSSSLSSSTETNIKTRRRDDKLDLRRRLKVLQLNIRRHAGEGNLYAGLVPSLLVSVPATGVYYAVRDVTKRSLNVAHGLELDDATITLLGALIADVVSLMARTPADALAARLQAAAASKYSTNIATGSSGLASIIGNETVASGKATEMSSAGTVDAFSGSEDSAVSPIATNIGINETDSIDAEDSLFRDEAEHYKQKETTILVNNTHTVDSLIASVLPEEYHHEEHVLLAMLQRKEYNVNELMQGLNNPNQEDTVGLTRRQRKRLQRKLQLGQRMEEKRIRPTMATNMIEIDSHHAYTQEFLEAQKSDEISFPTTMTSTLVDNWDTPDRPLQIERSKPSMRSGDQMAEREKTNPHVRDEESSLEKETSETQAANATSVSETVDDGNTAIRMREEEEKQLVQELQEENVYQGDWFRQSLERLPAIIITDLPYLLSRIALNRIIIHGRVSIGQYEVETIGIAMLCALLSTPFDVVRTRLLVENNDSVDVEEIRNQMGEANATIVGAYGNILLVGNTTDAEITPGMDSVNQGVLQTMISIAKEGDGGVRNLYAGWLERTAYYGIGRAWLDPINIITYVGIRDTLLLQWFD